MKTIEERLKDLEQLLSDSIADNREIRSSISAGFEKIDKNFTVIDKHFAIINEKVAGLDKKIDTFSGQTDKNLDTVNFHLVSIKEEITKINKVTGYEEEHNNLLRMVNGKD